MNIETIKYLSAKETERVLSKITSTRDKALFTLMYLYGLRCVEAANLNLEDLRLNDGRLYIHAAKKGISGEVVLRKDVKRLLAIYIKERCACNGHTDAIFLSRKSRTGDGRLSTTQIYRLFRKYAEKAKLPVYAWHPHVLRHSIAVHMANDGVNPAVVQAHLRHKKLENTMVYYQITDKKRHEFQALALAGESIARI